MFSFEFKEIQYEMIRQLEAYFLDDMPGDDNNEVFGRLDG